MAQNRKFLKHAIEFTAVATGVAFVGLSLLAKKKKGASVYEDEPEQKNPLEGKNVVFVPDENDAENADGERGHLEASGETIYEPGIYDKYIKRGLDIALSFGGLVALSPALAGIAAAVYIDDPGPVLFTQKRVGQNKQYFKLHKFRSMKMCTPHDVPTHMLDNPEQYITKVGKFLRAHSLDELPQIWDIFIGNMSVIGPRPALWNQDILVAERDKYGANDVKPGLTGWAQINGRDELEIPEKARLDGEYVAKQSFAFDAKCFLGTVSKVANDDSVVEGGTGEMKKKQETAEREWAPVEDIEGKKILFLAPAFFEYEKKIKAKMEEMGAEVDLYDERSVTGALDRALLKISPDLFEKKTKQYYDKIISENKEKTYDYILIVKCDMITKEILAGLRKQYPEAKLCLYLWDSMKNIPKIEEKLSYFDTIHSFDPEDCESRDELQFRPLFYSDEFGKRTEKLPCEYDLCFAGTIHSDRYAILRKIRNFAEREGLRSYWFCYLQSKFIYYFYKATKPEFKTTELSDFSYEKLSGSAISDIVDKSEVIVDIQHPKQTGLTMRTIEMLGMEKKLITTNATIRNYDFYNPNNILVVDRNAVHIDREFLETAYEPVSEEIYEKYSLKNWILEVLN